MILFDNYITPLSFIFFYKLDFLAAFFSPAAIPPRINFGKLSIAAPADAQLAYHVQIHLFLSSVKGITHTSARYPFTSNGLSSLIIAYENDIFVEVTSRATCSSTTFFGPIGIVRFVPTAVIAVERSV